MKLAKKVCFQPKGQKLAPLKQFGLLNGKKQTFSSRQSHKAKLKNIFAKGIKSEWKK